MLLPIAEFKLTGFVTSLAVVVFCLCQNLLQVNSNGGHLRQILAFIGRNSLLIYLTHMAALGVLRVLFERVLNFDTHSGTFVLISTVAVIAGALTLGSAIRAIMPAKACRHLGVSD